MGKPIYIKSSDGTWKNASNMYQKTSSGEWKRLTYFNVKQTEGWSAQLHCCNFINEVNIDPTCTTAAMRYCKCDLCNEQTSLETVGPPLGHNYLAQETVNSTCITEGYTKYKCSRCDTSYTENLPFPGSHTMNTFLEGGGCRESSQYVERCTLCGYVASVTASGMPDGHSFKTIEVTAAGKCSYTDYVCEVCGVRAENVDSFIQFDLLDNESLPSNAKPSDYCKKYIRHYMTYTPNSYVNVTQPLYHTVSCQCGASVQPYSEKCTLSSNNVISVNESSKTITLPCDYNGSITCSVCGGTHSISASQSQAYGYTIYVTHNVDGGGYCPNCNTYF